MSAVKIESKNASGGGTARGHEVAALVRMGKQSAVSLLDDQQSTIEAIEPGIHAMITRCTEEARHRAEEIDQLVEQGGDPGPLAGLAIVVKDNLCTRGVRTTCASRILEDWHPPYTATAVLRAVEAGAIVIGKSNLDEFGMGSSTENSAFFTTRNPVNRERVPGGSSGGSAAAVAAGYALLGLGSDTGGSVRQPAALCGVVGLKPTYGRVSRYGLVAYASSLDTVGVFGRSVADAALLIDTVSGHDPLDSTSLAMESTSCLSALDGDVTKMRIGVVKELMSSIITPEIRNAVLDAVKSLEDMGATIVELSLPMITRCLPAYYLIASAEASSNLARYDGVRYGLRVDGPDVESMNTRTRTAGFGAEVKRRIMLGTYALSAGYYDQYYDKALRVRTLVLREFREAFDDVDALIGPVTPTTAFSFGERRNDPYMMYQFDVCTVAVNLAGTPAISVPYSLGADGMPIGVQVIGPQTDEDVCIRIGAALERVAPVWNGR